MSNSHATADNRIRKHKYVICSICKASPKTRIKLLKVVDDATIKALCDVIKTVACGKLGEIISPKNRKKLKQHTRVLTSLVSSNKSIKTKRKILNQQGSGVLSSIGSFIEKLFGF